MTQQEGRGSAGGGFRVRQQMQQDLCHGYFLARRDMSNQFLEALQSAIHF